MRRRHHQRQRGQGEREHERRLQSGEGGKRQNRRLKEIEGDETEGGGGRRRKTASYSLKQLNLPYTSETSVGRGHLHSQTDCTAPHLLYTLTHSQICVSVFIR